ncbi:hypothetical protein B4U80_00728 [Leptotrombidium deliense]|uniref:Lysosomal-associated transmembrane protein 4A-like protein n=1 Tax=Leptotrombidium deliense TaxID=299467 RepID=A0A443SUH7_9ACAR|nr:hypothetical protein B4U80_00728 [Leptotrombidium deliense]
MNRDRSFVHRYAYCLCLHVKPASIFLGIGYSLCGMLHLVTIGSHHDMEYSDGRHSMNAVHRSTATYLAITTYLFCATASGMLLYGVIKSRPAYLMPFFGIQLFDFFFSLPSFLSSLYAHTAHYNDLDATNPRFLDVKRVWPNASPAAIYSLSLLFAVCIMLYKSYFLCVVWKCYRYLKIQEIMLPINVRLPTVEVTVPIPNQPSYLPPDYDTATKSSPPPDYETAVKAAQSEENEKSRLESENTVNAANVAIAMENTTVESTKNDKSAENSH